VEPHLGQERVELFIMWNLLCQELVGGVSSLYKDNVVFWKVSILLVNIIRFTHWGFLFNKSKDHLSNGINNSANSGINGSSIVTRSNKVSASIVNETLFYFACFKQAFLLYDFHAEHG